MLFILKDQLNIEYNELNIESAMKTIDNTLLNYDGPEFSPGIAEENIQSRLRGLILMALSNRYGYTLFT